MLSLKTKELSSARDVIRSVCREIRLSFSRTWLIHTKRLTTNVLKFVLRLARVDQKTYVTLVNESGHQARSNVLTNTPQFKAFVEERKASRGKGGKAA
jgi:hypothetical protein